MIFFYSKEFTPKLKNRFYRLFQVKMCRFIVFWKDVNVKLKALYQTLT